MIAAAATTLPFGDAVAADFDAWLAVDLLVIFAITGLLILRDLSATNRPFDWGPIIRSSPFLGLMIIQSIMMTVLLVVLVGFGRATLRYGADALWVALAGVSLLKSLPVGKSDDGQRLWSLADWLFKRFYRSLSLEIVKQSNQLKQDLLAIYTSPAAFLTDVLSLISAIESAADAATDQQDVQNRYNQQPDDPSRIAFLANWVTPRTTRKEWRRLTGK